MNIVFWLLVAIVLVCIWILAAPAFKEIGETIITTFKTVKEEMTDDESEDN